MKTEEVVATKEVPIDLSQVAMEDGKELLRRISEAYPNDRFRHAGVASIEHSIPGKHSVCSEYIIKRYSKGLFERIFGDYFVSLGLSSVWGSQLDTALVTVGHPETEPVISEMVGKINERNAARNYPTYTVTTDTRGWTRKL